METRIDTPSTDKAAPLEIQHTSTNAWFSRETGAEWPPLNELQPLEIPSAAKFILDSYLTQPFDNPAFS